MQGLLDFSDVLIFPRLGSTVSSRSEVDIKVNGRIPIFASNMGTTGTWNMAVATYRKGMNTILHKFHTADDIIWHCKEYASEHDDLRNLLEHVGLSLGASHEDFKNLLDIINKFLLNFGTSPKFICLDVANGYLPVVKDVLKRLSIYKDDGYHEIIAGNVASIDGVENLAEYADWIKVGIGSGSVCTTRLKTGVGVPQVSLLEMLTDHFKDRVKIISDGGCTNPGDIAKAFALGADGVMIGGMLAGHDECAGELTSKSSPISYTYELKSYVKKTIVEHDPPLRTSAVYTNTITGEEIYDEFDVYSGMPEEFFPPGWIVKKPVSIPDDAVMNFYGMSSKEAAERHYKHAEKSHGRKTWEGKSVSVPYRGKVVDTLDDIEGGLRSAITYAGFDSLNDMIKAAKRQEVIAVRHVISHHNRIFET